jgi:hypothetical protein
MRKALAIIGMVQALVALAPILAEAAGPMGMAPSRGQSHQFSQNHQSNQNPQFNRSNQSFRGHPFPNYYPNYNRSNFYRYRYHRPNYYRPYYSQYYYPYYSSYYSAPPAYAPQQNYNYSGAPSGYGAPQSYLDIAPAPQIEREVFFPEGRYVLLGDGDAVPFRWVWVPNPPTAPPADTQDQR